MQKGSVNKVVLVGHLGGDPETRFTPSGAAVANFNLATNESWRDANGDIQDKTEWHRCVMFGKSAEMAGDFLKKVSWSLLKGSFKPEIGKIKMALSAIQPKWFVKCLRCLVEKWTTKIINLRGLLALLNKKLKVNLKMKIYLFNAIQSNSLIKPIIRVK